MTRIVTAEIAQLGERMTEDHKVAGSIPAFGILFSSRFYDLILNIYLLIL